ncbi:hypothetical protein CVIRNUC_008735 [Coccomyxa viridis]|uniref:Uncharacterized protein n=1 Tax=Coccomyxa viridis TaxID=1274662 RepID=A0AAV1IHN0_9CHLO|nr:hypothetical protein CVIRNUC_008735 [Coccomyxa viridis]
MISMWNATRGIFRQFGDGFRSLKDSPRDLYLTYLLMLCESFNYFSLSLLFVLYLTQEFGVGDVEGGTLYGLWGTLLVAYGVVFSTAIDLMGVKGSLIACYIISAAGRFVVATTTSKSVLLWTLLGPVTVAGSLGTPVQTIAIKRFTTEGNRGFAFSLFYSFMNMAALLCASVLDLFRVRLRHGFNIQSLPATHFLNDGTRLLLFMGVLVSGVALALSLCLRDSVPLKNSLKQAGRKVPPEGEEAPSGGEEAPLIQAEGSTGAEDCQGKSPVTCVSAASTEAPQLSGRASWQSFARDAKDIMASRETWKFMVMCLITVNLKQIFRHVDATLPKYLIRAYGCDAPVGLIYGINPGMIIFLVPFVGALTTHCTHFDMIHLGSYLSALSPLWIVAFPSHIWGAALFVVTLSLGESFWSPRWYDYSMSLAPHGREGIFTALASAPLFAAKLPTGFLSGYLLQEYCPDARACDAPTQQEMGELGRCDGRRMWGVIAGLTLMSPLLILTLQRWVRPQPRAAILAGRSAEGSSLVLDAAAGAHSQCPAVPLHDALEDQLVVDIALDRVGQGHQRQR